MIRGLLTATGKPVRLLGRLTAGVVVVAFIALSLKCFAVVPVPNSLAGNDDLYGLHGGGMAHHQTNSESNPESNSDHCPPHDDTSSDCCSILMSLLSNSPKDIQKAAAPRPSSTYIVAIIPVTTVTFTSGETFFDYDPPDKLSLTFLSTSSLSLRAPPMSV